MTPMLRAAAAALLSLCLAACGDGDAAAPSPAPATAGSATVAVEVAPVRARALDREVVTVGSLRADEAVTVSSEVAGRITRIAFDEGAPVKAGQLLFALDDAIVRAETARARAAVELARSNVERAAELVDRRLISSQERDELRSQLDVAEAALQLAEAQASKTRITAPFDGIAGLRAVSPGDYVDPGTALVDVQKLDPIKVQFRVPELELPSLAAGQPVNVEVDSWPGQVFSGEVYAVEPQVADDTRSIAVRARLHNEDLRLRPGQFARVRLVVERKASALTVPEEAVFPRGDRNFVFVVNGDGIVAEREVRIGQRLPGVAEVREGLAAEEQVIVAGLQRVSDGDRVVTQSGQNG